MQKPLLNTQRANPGKITITAEEMTATSNSEIVLFTPQAQLKDQNLNFFIIYTQISLGKFTPVYKSEVRRSQGGKHSFNQVQIGTTDLCKDNVENEIKIEFFRSNSSGKHKLLGHLVTTLGALKEGNSSFPLSKSAGNLTMENLKIESHHSFLEYIFGGCEVELSIAIDFTLSNGDPR